ncbi:uncharacterized protein EV420DRAFT_1100223 [Desarmillaria tabescens]|uniref:Uncharacterized protein n=1 Tax=Armillaria tabescens TaxID=1929756 RepID=A0AA39NDJ6_ARMTA|nr:uncharacterized protein EV420DRAFT_1100223 [Desarmillaria tabescens]KAK0463640.1 hypothetical protein EV420DRAFT_1100223 [Desarmillaria tabescens]
MDVSIPGQTQLSPLYYPPRPIGGFMQPATFPNSYQNNAFYVLPNNLYQQHQVQASNGSSSYPLNPTFGNFAPNPVSVWPQPSSSSHIATFNSYPFINEFAVNPSTNILRSKRDSQSSIATFESSSSGKRPRQEVEDPSGSWPDSKKTRSNSSTDNSSAVSGPNTEVQPGSTAKPPCLGYRTVVLCNDELREQLKSTPEQIPQNSRLFFLGGCPIVAQINQPLPSAEERAKREEEARNKDRTTGIPLTPEETQWLIGAYHSKTRRNPATNVPLDVLPHTSERVGRSHQYQFDSAPTPHQLSQVHHQQPGHRNQDLYVDAAVQNALPNQAQPVSLQWEPIPGDIMMHGAGGSSQSPAAASGFLDTGSRAPYNGMAESTSDCIPRAMKEPASYPPSNLANQGSNFAVGPNGSSPTLITSPSCDDTAVLMNHGHFEGVPRPFQVFQGSDVFESLCKKTKDDDDDDDESLFGVFSE